MILIHTALLCEAQSIIEQYKLKKINSIPKIYSNDNILVLIGGIGKENTITSLKYIFSNFTISKAMNVGIAGCGDHSIPIGELYCTNHQLIDIQYKELITVDTPIISTKQSPFLFDMEGKYFYEICLNYVDEKNIFLLKVVSDYLDIEKIDKNSVKSLIHQNIRLIVSIIDF